MPEGPELHLSAVFINRACENLIFSGKTIRNPIHKSDEIIWDEPEYTIRAESRGKELMLHLFAVNSKDSKKKTELKSTSIQFRFGMSGKFEYTRADELKKHSHLQFLTKDEPKMALSFVDYRRFGRWFQDQTWSAERGPCVIQEFHAFVKHVADNVNNAAFNRPICEVLLNQKFFNGIGNYLRAEILYRCKIPPFENAKTVLKLRESPETSKNNNEVKTEVKTEIEESTKKNSRVRNSQKRKNADTLKEETSPCKTPKLEPKDACDSTEDFLSQTFEDRGQQVLRLCHTLPQEVVVLGSKKNSLSEMYYDDTDGSFNNWLQCYFQPGMKNLVDHNKRTVWFTGPPGSMVPKEQKNRNHKTKGEKTVNLVSTQEHDHQKTDVKKPKNKENHKENIVQDKKRNSTRKNSILKEKKTIVKERKTRSKANETVESSNSMKKNGRKSSASSNRRSGRNSAQKVDKSENVQKSPEKLYPATRRSTRSRAM